MTKPASPDDHADLSAPKPTDAIRPPAPFAGGTPGDVVTPDGVVPSRVPEHVSPEAEQYLHRLQRLDDPSDQEAIAVASQAADAEAGDVELEEEPAFGLDEEEPLQQDQAAYRLAQAMVALFSVILLVLFFLMFVDVIPGVPRWVRYVMVLLGLSGLAMMMLPRLTQRVADSIQPGNDTSDD